MNPRALCMAGDLILFRVAIATGCLRLFRYSPLPWREYFVYRAEPNRATLELLPGVPNGGLFFHDSEVGILPRGNDEFTIAALVPCAPCRDKFELLLFHSSSKARSWTSMKLSVVGPPKKFPIEVNDRDLDLSLHLTTNVITVGGEYGTIGWVDLWRGILFCDVLSEKPKLRAMPVPLPMDHIFGNNGLGREFGRGVDSRGIALVNGCLKFVELDLSVTEPMPIIMDHETGCPTLMVHDWTITTYSNSKTSCSYEDWRQEGMVRSSEATINPMVSHSAGGLLLLLPPSHSREHGEKTAATREALLQELLVSEPSPSLGGDGVVYLVARVKMFHPKAWLIALDMSSNTLQSVVPFVISEEPDEDANYCTSRH
uniref:Uncharacterized protein n=1 Tax=Avena sativa TaxID=4498 RepID=A0ACD5Y6D3_AVESA